MIDTFETIASLIGSISQLLRFLCIITLLCGFTETLGIVKRVDNLHLKYAQFTYFVCAVLYN